MQALELQEQQVPQGLGATGAAGQQVQLAQQELQVLQEPRVPLMQQELLEQQGCRCCWGWLSWAATGAATGNTELQLGWSCRSGGC